MGPHDLDLARRRRRRAGLVLLLLSLSLMTLGAGATSLALWTDSAASTGSFATGTVDIATSPAVLFNVSAMMPGDSGQATLAVNNAGTATFRYALTSTNDNATLAAAMTLTVSTGACGSTTGTLYTGALSGAGFGSSAQGAQAGDRTLAGGAGESLCFAWSFPTSAANALQGQSVSATFTFNAEQTANNP